MFIDRATIYVRAGKGGDGCVSFRREKYIPKGGPDGGDGGRGGDVILYGDAGYDTLLHLARYPHHRAEHGGQGKGRQMHGEDGSDCTVPVPIGTVVINPNTNETLADIIAPGQTVIVARGGRGGRGNEHFKSATNQTPRESTPGGTGEELTLCLELKLLADVGLVGLPNAGKSTLLRAVSRATPKVADYPFTTLSPHLGIAELTNHRRLVIADIPGLIAGAAQGAGLGHAFLRHIERTTMLVHLLDVAPIDGSDPAENYHAIRNELKDYSDELAAKPEIVALNKIDLLPADEREAHIKEVISSLKISDGTPTVAISGATRDGVLQLLEACWDFKSSTTTNPPAVWHGAT